MPREYLKLPVPLEKRWEIFILPLSDETITAT